MLFHHQSSPGSGDRPLGRGGHHFDPRPRPAVLEQLALGATLRQGGPGAAAGPTRAVAAGHRGMHRERENVDRPHGRPLGR